MLKIYTYNLSLTDIITADFHAHYQQAIGLPINFNYQHQPDTACPICDLFPIGAPISNDYHNDYIYASTFSGACEIASCASFFNGQLSAIFADILNGENGYIHEYSHDTKIHTFNFYIHG